MLLSQRVRRMVCIGGNAFRARDINEGVIAGLVCFLSHRANGSQLFFRVDEAFVAPGNIVVYFDSKDIAFLRLADDLFRIVGLQAVAADADIVRPILSGGKNWEV